ncbi:MAG: hypothetical protein ACYDD0_08950, partial [Candidatus Dormibacteria bacterium]
AATVTISGTVGGGRGGSLQVNLTGQPISGGGLSHASGSASFRPAGGTTVYQGRVTNLQGSVLGMTLQSPGGAVIPAELILGGAGSTPSHAVGQLHFGTVRPPSGSSQGDDG